MIRRQSPLRRTPLARMSVKRRKANRERNRRMIAAFGETPACAIRWDDRCRGWADAPHELLKASQGGSRLDPTNAIPACNPCNSAVEDNPRRAHERGFVVLRKEAQ